MSSPELRIDQLTGLPVILAPGRADRPENFRKPKSEPKGPENCPFCEGREDRTPPEVYATRPGGGEADTPGWTTRVVPNLYPALGGDAAKGGVERVEPDLFASRPASGAHEVIVNGPGHVTAMAELDGEQFAAAIETWRARMRAHADASYVQVIVNEGAGAGASLDHTHAQLYALDFVPAAVARERERAGAYSERTAGGGGLLSDVLVEEVRRRERLVAIDEEAALICPWASRSPFELRVVPRVASPSFAEDGGGAAMIRTALRLLAERFDSPELNLWVRTAPRGAEPFHWHVDVAPRLSTKAAFEFSTGVDINTYPPERAAADLREVFER